MRCTGRFRTPRERRYLLAISSSREGDTLAGTRAAPILHRDVGGNASCAAEAIFASPNAFCAWRPAIFAHRAGSVGLPGRSGRAKKR